MSRGSPSSDPPLPSGTLGWFVHLLHRHSVPVVLRFRFDDIVVLDVVILGYLYRQYLLDVVDVLSIEFEHVGLLPLSESG